MLGTKPNHDFLLNGSGYSNYEGSATLPRHRWYYYKEGFSPDLVKQAIQETCVQKREIIIDPFNGSGTTTLTAALLGHRSIGIEVNPFTSFLAAAKLKSVTSENLRREVSKMIFACEKGAESSLVNFSTFSYRPGLSKWLFNHNILTSFEGGWRYTIGVREKAMRCILQLLLISSIMENCNAIRDGKCLRYRKTWKTYGFQQETFVQTILDKLIEVESDIKHNPIVGSSTIMNGDVRKVLRDPLVENFKLCITSPPYLNTFDYTDIYRPELFLGKFVRDNHELYNLRLKTVRSHIQAKWTLPSKGDFGSLYDKTMIHMSKNDDLLMDKSIPVMIQAYFEDMQNILSMLKRKAQKGGQVWLVVSNSAYANHEIPVDLIIADIGTQVGWSLREVGVLRYIQKRKSNHSQTITQLRESVIILSNSK